MKKNYVIMFIIAVTSTLFFINNAICEDRLVIKDGATETFKVDQSGKIFTATNLGIGTESPERQLHMKGGNAVARIDRSQNSASFMLVRTNPADGSIYKTFVFGVNADGVNDGTFFIRDNGTATTGGGVAVRLFIDNDGNVGIGTTNPAGALDVNGQIYQRGNRIHADYVYGDDYSLESIDDHSRYMWKNKHLSAVPEMTKDRQGNEVVEIGSHQRGILEELEKAHIYIEQLNDRIKKLEEKMSKN